MQAPHVPRSQTRLTPVMSSRSRSASSSVTRGSTVEAVAPAVDRQLDRDGARADLGHAGLRAELGRADEAGGQAADAGRLEEVAAADREFVLRSHAGPSESG